MTIIDYRVVRNGITVESTIDANVKRVSIRIATITDVDNFTDVLTATADWNTTTGLAVLKAAIIANATEQLAIPNDAIVNQITAAI